MNVCHNIILAGLISLRNAGNRRTGAAAQFDISPEQLEKYRQLYPDADTNKDGKLTLEEARAYLKKIEVRRGDGSGRRGEGRAGRRPRARKSRGPPSAPRAARAGRRSRPATPT